MKVQVKPGFTGYFDHIRRREGDVFTIPDQPRRLVSQREQEQFPRVKEVMDKKGEVPRLYSSRWMEPVAKATPERTTTGKQALEQFHDQVLAERAASRQADGQVI